MRDDGGRQASLAELLRVLAPPILLIVAVLGAILIGVATPTESAAVGAGGALVLAMSKKTLTAESFFAAMQQATRITCMVFIIFVGANIFALVFRGFGGDTVIHEVLSSLPGGLLGAFIG